jgi:photosystem II stability/assembly factor-like uncharacterized protein
VGIHWLFDIEIDPANPNHAMFTTGYGGHETFNLEDADRGKPVKWSIMSTGIEESVGLHLESPPRGAHLISAIGDYGGFVHWNLDKPAPEGNFDHPHFGNTTGVAAAVNSPNILVRVGSASGRGSVNFGYSLDFGKSWQPPVSVPTPAAREGSIAVSADGSTWVWSVRSGQYFTRDRSKTWTPCSGLSRTSRVVASSTDPSKFYAVDYPAGTLYVSSDGAASFLPESIPPLVGRTAGGNRFDARGGQDQVYSTPAKANDLWLAGFDGLWHTADDGKTYRQTYAVEELHAFGFGKAPPDSTYPALYLVGTVRGAPGIFRSDDEGASWVRINDDAHQWGLILQIAGDPRIYGRVYVGTHGRGIFYGDPK